MKSIKTRLVGSFILVIVISIGVLVCMLIAFIQRYYYNNLEETLTSQVKTSADFYSRYFSNASLEENVLGNVDVFWKQTTAQVQIIDVKGKVLLDSIGFMPKKFIHTNDFKTALNGEKGSWVGRVEYDNADVMAVSYPLQADNRVVGVLRFITTLREVNNEIRQIAAVLVAIGAMVVVLASGVSVLLANSIIRPVKEVTRVAEKMAQGYLKVRSSKIADDEIGRLSDTLNYMAEEILKKDQIKNEFICSVSHELRTPLTSIKGWVDTLNMEECMNDRDILKDGLLIIAKENERLIHMVEELLDLSKFVSGKIALNKEVTDIGPIFTYLNKYMEPRALREQVHFTVEHQSDMPQISIDRDRIKQVLINLVDNAFKFTPGGGSINVSAKADGKYICIDVSDDGCGISTDELPRVKEKFFKGRNSKSQNGIGLSICDEIIKLHDGIFEIESELNKGTRVKVKLPV